MTRGLQICRLATCSSFPRGLHGKAELRADAGFHRMLVVGTANTDTAAVGAGPHSSCPVGWLAVPTPPPAHPPLPINLWKSCLPCNWSLVQKRLVTTDLEHRQNSALCF